MKKNIFKNVVAINRALAEEFKKLGTAKLLAGDYKGADFDLEIANWLIPENSHPLYMDGIRSAALDDHTQETENFEEAPEINPDGGCVHYRLAMCHFMSENYELAVENFDLFLKEEPGQPDALYYRGRSLDALGLLDEAIVSYTHALDADSQMIQVYYRRSQARSKAESRVEAKQDIKPGFLLDFSRLPSTEG